MNIITERQMGRIEAACYGLETLTEKNEVGRRLVATIREALDEIDADNADGAGLSDLPEESDAEREEGEKLGCLWFLSEALRSGSNLAEALKLTMREGALLQQELARMLGMPASTLSEYLKHGKHAEWVLARVTESCGDAGGADDESNGTK